MGVVVESSVWEPTVSIYVFLTICILFSLALSPHSSSSNTSNNNKLSPSSSVSPFEHSTSPFLRFRRKFLLLYSLASVMEGVWSVAGEFDFRVGKDGMLASLCIGYAASLLVGSLLGMLSDTIGHKKACLLFCILHLVIGIWRRITSYPSMWFVSVCLSLATSIFSCSFESWLVVENEQQGYRQDTLNDTFWLMTFVESVMLVGSQVLANWIVGTNVERGMVSLSTAAIFLAILSITYVSKGWKEAPQTTEIKDYMASYTYVLTDKRMWLLGLAHTCLHFSITIFWILWAPTLVADGREVHLGLIYPCLLGARMLGSSVFQWLLSGPSSPRTEDCLITSFAVLGLVLSVVAFDYQEIGVLVSLFCLFHAGVGLILPSLAKLRTMHVPSELRGGMMSLSLAPGNAAILFLLIQRGYYQNIENSTLMAFAALALFIAAGCMHLLKRWGKQLYHNGHKL